MPARRRIFGLALWGALTVAGQGLEAQARAQPSRSEPFPDLATPVRQDLVRGPATGGALAWIDQDGIRWIDAFGSEDLDGNMPMTVRHRMHLGTFGDFLLAALAAEMDGLGVVDLDAPVRQVVDGLAPGIGSRSLTQLLLHTAGFDAAPLAARPRGTEAYRMRVDEAHRLLDDRVLMLPAGAIRSPSPHHTLLASRVLGARGGGSLDGAFRTYLFRPAGIAEAVFAPPGGAPAGAHPGFQVRLAAGMPYTEAPFPEPAVLQPQERLWMHAADLARLLHYVLFRSPHGAQVLLPRVGDPDGVSGQGAFGLAVRWDDTGRGGWKGEGPGYTVELRVLAEYGALLLAMSNGGASPLTRGLDALGAWIERNATPESSHRSAAAGPSGPPAGPLGPWGISMDHAALPYPPAIPPGPEVSGRYRNGSEMFHLRWRSGALEADLGIGRWLPIREAEDGALEAYLDDGRTAFRFRLLALAGDSRQGGGAGATRSHPSVRYAAYTRGGVFTRDPSRSGGLPPATRPDGNDATASVWGEELRRDP